MRVLNTFGKRIFFIKSTENRARKAISDLRWALIKADACRTGPHTYRRCILHTFVLICYAEITDLALMSLIFSVLIPARHQSGILLPCTGILLLLLAIYIVFQIHELSMEWIHIGKATEHPEIIAEEIKKLEKEVDTENP